MRNKLIVAFIVIALFSAGCSVRAVPTVPAPPDVAATIKTIADSNLSSDAKSAAIQQVLATAERQYTAELQRAEKSGSNLKDIVLQILAIGSSIATVTLQASK